MGQKEQQGREGRTPPIRSDENLDDAFGWKRRVILHRFTVLPFIKLNSYFWYSFHIFLVVCPPYLYISTSSTFLYVFLFFTPSFLYMNDFTFSNHHKSGHVQL